MKDFFSDSNFKVLVGILHNQDSPEVGAMIKTAALESENEDISRLPASAFAEPVERRYPLHTKNAALLSYVYAIENKASDNLITKIAEALDLYGAEIPEICMYKKAGEVNYLLKEKGNFPASNQQEVRIACEYFRNYSNQLSYEDRQEYSRNLVKVAAELNIDPSSIPSEVKRYAGITGTDMKKVAYELQNRISICKEQKKDGVYSKSYEKLANELPKSGVSTIDAEVFNKIASIIQFLDRESGVDSFYGKTINNPHSAIFNIEKLAEESLEIGGTHCPMSKIMSLPKDELSDVLGGDLANEITDKTGSLNMEELKSILPTLPLDMKKNLAKRIGQL